MTRPESRRSPSPSLARSPSRLAACGEKSEDTTGERSRFSLTLDFYPNPDHAGIYMAQKLGYFEEAGLDVSIDTPSDPAAPLKLVAAGRSDLAISYEPEVALAHEQGLDVVAVAALVNRPLTSLIWLQKSGHQRRRRPQRQDRRHRRHPLPGRLPEDDPRPRQASTPATSRRSTSASACCRPCVGGSAEAMLGGFSNVEGVDLRERGKAPVVTPVDQLGVPTYDELVLVANRQSLEEDPEKFRLFIAALRARHRRRGRTARRGDHRDPRSQPRTSNRN